MYATLNVCLTSQTHGTVIQKMYEDNYLISNTTSEEHGATCSTPVISTYTPNHNGQRTPDNNNN